MTEDDEGKDRGPGPFRLLRRCDEVEPRLGRLYESWNVVTGRPALTLFPSDTTEWQPSAGPWRGWIFFDPGAQCVSLELERRAVEEPVSEWMNVFTMIQLAGERVEDSPHVNAHFTARPPSQLALWNGRVRQVASSRSGWVTAALVVLVLALGIWQAQVRRPESPAQAPRSASTLINLEAGEVIMPAYPLPDQPFSNQGVPPCDTKRGAVEIKGGCWVALDQKPPCLEDQAEYESKCYLPTAKKKPVKPSVEH